MAKKEKNAFMGSTSKIFLIDPKDLTLVTDKKDPLYDERVTLAPNEALVNNIMVHGVIEPIIVSKDGPKAVVVDGRQRTIAAIEANKRLKKEGGAQIKIPCVKKTGEDSDLFGILISTNEHRRDDNPLEKSKKLEKYLSIGGTEEEATVHFGVSKATIKNWLRILELAAPVKKAVKDGVISASAAGKLSAMEKDDQIKTLNDLIKKGEGKPTAKKAENKVRKEKAVEHKLRKKAEILEMSELSKDTLLEDLFAWLFGKEEIDWEQYGLDFEEDEEETEGEETEEETEESDKSEETEELEAGEEW